MKTAGAYSNSRREFLKTAAGAVMLPGGAANRRRAVQPRLRFAAIGLNHSHIAGLVSAVTAGGGELVKFHAAEADLAAAFGARYPSARSAGSAREILDDPSIPLIISAAIPSERAPLAIDAMRHGKDILLDKPAATTLEQLADLRRVQRETGRIFSVLIERHEHQAFTRALELVHDGAIGRVLQIIGLGPHRMNPETRPPWFFKRQQYGGVLVDLASHKFDQFVAFTGSTRADVVASQVGNLNHPRFPEIEDFGDVTLRGDRGLAYIRVDWFTPAGMPVFGDGRVTILGTDGYMEIRASIDIAGRGPGTHHLFLADGREPRYIDCSGVPLRFGERLVDDVIHRTETAGRQDQTFLALELALRAQQQARRVS
jgi:predicted dehydrogenase